MNKTLVISLFFIAILVGLGFYYGGDFLKQDKIVNSIGSGEVLEVSGSTVTVRGFLESPDVEKKLITVNFTIDDKTKYTKTTVVLDTKKHSDGEFFTPEMVEMEGNLSDIKKGTRIRGVRTNDTLDSGVIAKALEINYTVVSFR